MIINCDPKYMNMQVDYKLRKTLNGTFCVERIDYLGVSNEYFTISNRRYFKELEKAKKYKTNKLKEVKK